MDDCRRFKKKCSQSHPVTFSLCWKSHKGGWWVSWFFFGIDKTPLSDVSELFLKEIKWTANPDGSLSMPIPPTKQPKPDLETYHPLMELSTQWEATSMTLIMSILDILAPFPTVMYLRISLAADNKTVHTCCPHVNYLRFWTSKPSVWSRRTFLVS